MRKECRNCGALERADGSCDCVSVHGGVVRFGRPQITQPQIMVGVDGQHMTVAEISARLGLRIRDRSMEIK